MWLSGKEIKELVSSFFSSSAEANIMEPLPALLLLLLAQLGESELVLLVDVLVLLSELVLLSVLVSSSLVMSSSSSISSIGKEP